MVGGGDDPVPAADRGPVRGHRAAIDDGRPVVRPEAAVVGTVSADTVRLVVDLARVHLFDKDGARIDP
ncbi:hypothetical protein GCM10023259_025230 [Thermocatellispora tengchongensis]